jgi:hypothetical protein
VIPSEWGTHQKWYFCVLPRFWCPEQINTSKRGFGSPDGPSAELGSLPHRQLSSPHEADALVSGASPSPSPNGHGSVSSNRSHYFEQVPDAVRENLGVSIRGLHKKFVTDGEAEPFVAVKDMNLDLYSGQILALLGHNGAGSAQTHHTVSNNWMRWRERERQFISSVRPVCLSCLQQNDYDQHADRHDRAHER